jgi:hypothetical protein
MRRSPVAGAAAGRDDAQPGEHALGDLRLDPVSRCTGAGAINAVRIRTSRGPHRY